MTARDLRSHPFALLILLWTIMVILLRIFVFNEPDEFSRVFSNDDGAIMLWIFGLLCIGFLWLTVFTGRALWKRRRGVPSTTERP